MSKVLRTAGMVVAAVALVATTAGLAAPAVAATATTAASAGGIAGISAATLTAIGTYGSLAAGVLSVASAATAPGFSAQGSKTTFTTNPQSGLPYAMGRTRMSGLRVYARTYDGFKQKSKDDILAFVAMLSIAGPIQGIEQFTADGEEVTFAANGDANGRFYAYMCQDLSLGNSPSTALAMQFGGKPFPGWTSFHTLSGIAHAQWALRFDKDGDLYGAGAPEPAWIGQWVKVYDPRKDSTYPGGSGSHRALDESTYEWSDNPGLHALTWALGRWQNGKRVCGIGAPVDTIRISEFVECANVCEANGWTVGGVEWTTDSKWDTLKRILQAGGAKPTQTGAMIGCLVSTPRTAIATIENRHLLDSLSLAMTKSRRDRFNSVIPRYVDEDSDWAVISGTAITVPDYVTADGGQRTKEIDFPLVQVFSGDEATQPGQLAAYEIVNSREAGPFTFTTGPEWIGLKTGDVIYLDVPEEGLDNQPVLVTKRAIDPATGKVSFTVETETYSKHAYALGQTTVPPAPFSLTAPDLKPAEPGEIGWSITGTTSGEGFPALLVAGESEMPSADALVIDYRLHDAADWTNAAIVSAVEPIRHVIAPLESETAYDVRISYRVGSIDGNYTVFSNVITGVGKLTTIESQVGDHDAEIAQLESDTAQAELDIAAAQANITSLQSDAAALQTDLSAAQADIIANSDDLATVNTTLSSHSASITSLQTTASSQAGQIATLESTVSTQGASISSNTTAITTAQGNIATLQSNLSTANANISTNTSAITGINTSIATINSTLSTQGASISQNAGAITGLEGNVATLTAQVTAGSPNLLPNGSAEAGLSKWSGSSSWVVVQVNPAGSYFLLGGTNSGTFVLSSDPIALAPGTYTISYEVQNSGSASLQGYCDVLCYDASGNLVLDGPSNIVTGPSSWNNREYTALTFTAPASTATMRVRLIGTKVNAADRVRIRRVKLESGSQWSAYSSEASVTEAFSTLSTLNASYASLSTTVSTQGVTITSQQTAITTIEGNVTTLFGRAGVTVDVNGNVTGWEINNNGTTGDFTIRSDRFRVIPPGGSGSDGFYIDIDGSNRTTQYILDSGVRRVEIGWLA